MKNTFIVLAILCAPAFFSFSKIDGEKFTGTWKVLHDGRTVNQIEIIKDGEMYELTYNTGEWRKSGEQKKLTLTFKYKDGTLINPNGYKSVEFIESSGHLKWNEDEWEKSSEKVK